jgi:hypothetical protein
VREGDGSKFLFFGRMFDSFSLEPIEDQVDFGLSDDFTVTDLDPAVRVGAIVFNGRGNVRLVEPTDHFDGYAWTFPKAHPAPGLSLEDAGAAVASGKGGVAAAAFGVLNEEYGGTPGGTLTRYVLMFDLGHPAVSIGSPYVERALWATPSEARRMISTSTNLAGRARDLKALGDAVAELSMKLSFSSHDDSQRASDSSDPHWLDWFRLERPFGMEGDGSPVTLDKLRAMVSEAVEYYEKAGMPTEAVVTLGEMRRRHPVTTPTRTFDDDAMDRLRLGLIDDRGMSVFEGDTLYLYRTRSGNAIYEAHFAKSPVGWRIDRVDVDPEHKPALGTDAWEAVCFEHIVVNLLLKSLDEGLWRRFFASAPTQTFC